MTLVKYFSTPTLQIYNHIVVKIMKTKNSIYPTHVFHCHQAISSIFVKRHLNNHFPPYSFDLIDNITWCRYRNVMKTCDGTHSIGASLHNGSYWVHKVRFSHLETNLNQEIAPFFGDYFLLFFSLSNTFAESLTYSNMKNHLKWWWGHWSKMKNMHL